MIRRILKEEGGVGSQAQLLQRLRESGVDITQATLSRDLRLMGVTKHPDSRGGYHYAMDPDEEHRVDSGFDDPDRLLRGFLNLAFSGNFGLVKTLPGYANSIAFCLDSMGISEILATIAGDDTILVIPRDGISRKQMAEAMIRRVPEIREIMED